jgi:acetoin utilization protein AcuB
MFAETLISSEIFPLKKSDSCETASVFMHDWSVAHLPVVENNKVIGYVALSEITDHPKSTKIEKLIRNDRPFIVSSQQHLFELLKIVDESSLTTISVINAENNFIGIISYKELIKDIYRNSSLAQLGGIVTIEMLAKDYSLAELSRIAEYNDIKIINVFINTAVNDNNTILVSLKFNQADLKNVIASLERHGKIVRSIHQAMEIDDSYTNRYDWLIKYLNT